MNGNISFYLKIRWEDDCIATMQKMVEAMKLYIL